MELVDKKQVLSVIREEITKFPNTYTRDALTHILVKIDTIPEVKESVKIPEFRVDHTDMSFEEFKKQFRI
jgi:hypothetical protein